MKKLLLITLLLLTSCTDAERARFTNYLGERAVKCFSGGQLIYEGTSTGKINHSIENEKFSFKEKSTGKMIKIVNSNCVVTYNP